MGVVLGIYLGTVLTSYAVAYLDDKVTKAKLDREGYIDTTKQSTPEKIKDLIQMGLLLAVPVLNIALAAFVLFSSEVDKLYEEYKKEGIADGTIIKKDAAVIESEKELMDKKELLKRKNQATLNRLDSQNKAYSEMTTDEKLLYLEREKAFLLSLKDVKEQPEKSYNDRGAYTKKS